jgi:uncharacterized membrane protein YphA (DoxX/SURF4 family)/chitodextrinase
MSRKALFEEIIDNRWLIFALRVALGGIFIAASVTKLSHQAEFIDIVISYGILPDSLAHFYALILPWVELVIGCSLVLGLFTRFAAALSIPVIVSFIIASAYGLFQAVGGSCGCFGQSIPINHSASLAIDVLMLLMAVTLLLHKHEVEFLSIGPLLSRLNLGLGRRRFIFEEGSKFAIIALAVLIIGMPLLYSAATNQLSNQPVNVLPVDGATGISLTPTLHSSASSNPDGGSHTASQWQITLGCFCSPLFDSGIDTVNLTSITIPSGKLSYNTTYYWHVKYEDNDGVWSSWSKETSFTTQGQGAPSQPPHQPSNTLPANGATGLPLTPTLQSSVFFDPDGDSHAASQWQIRTDGSPVFDSDRDTTNLTSIIIPSGKLSYNTTYYWHVKYQDSNGDWSDWSNETSFTTQGQGALNQRPHQPNNTSPSDGATGVGLTPTLNASAFSDPDVGDNHTASRWQITSGCFCSPLFDSGIDTVNLTSITIPPGILSPGATYYWRVQYQDSHGGESFWSAATSFTT